MRGYLTEGGLVGRWSPGGVRRVLVGWRVPEPEQNEEDLDALPAEAGRGGYAHGGGDGAEMGTFYMWVCCSGS